jgi:hypothetical protein
MACPTREQLAANALGIADDEKLIAHVDECDQCRRIHTVISHLSGQLSIAHAELNGNHAASREALLARLNDVERPKFADHRKRFVAGGLGLVIAASLLVAAFLNTSATRLSAMERMVKAVREVTSYSFKSIGITKYPAKDGKPGKMLYETGFLCWRTPADPNSPWYGDLHSVVKAWRVTDAELGVDHASEPRIPKWALDIEETYPCGKSGIIIVYSQGMYFFCPPTTPDEVPPDNWIARLRAVQQGMGEIVRDLGTKLIDGRSARGYIVDFHDAVPFKGDGPVEVWVDPKTDLPIEFSYEWRDDDQKGVVDENHITNCHWNIPLDDELFDTQPPPGLINTTAPKDEKTIAQMVAALRMYAELSGGHYPRVRTIDPGKRRDPDAPSDPPSLFDAGKIQSEMFELSGFTGKPQPEWREDPTYRKILSTASGLDHLARVLYDNHHAGYYGADVGPQEKDKVLLWFVADRGMWRICYGDLRMEVVPEAVWEKLVPNASPD